MSFKIVRNDIVKMNTEAVVNTANAEAIVGGGCDHAIYEAAGREELLTYRTEKIGRVQEGEVFLTPGFNLSSEYIIHAVSPRYIDGEQGEEEKLRACYRKSMQLAKEEGIRSIAFPLLASGSFGYPKEEAMRIALDEINGFLLNNKMDIYLVVFDTKATELGELVYPDLRAYIDRNYVLDKREEEYGDRYFGSIRNICMCEYADECIERQAVQFDADDEDAVEDLKQKLDERIAHASDSFSEYLLYLIKSKGMTNAEVYRRSIVDKRLFAKIKNDSKYHPQKKTCLCLCVGAMLNLDETNDLLARAGYALSPSDLQDIIFKYFIENEIYDMIELDIQLEEYGLECIIA